MVHRSCALLMSRLFRLFPIVNSVYMIGEKGADIIKATYPELYLAQP